MKSITNTNRALLAGAMLAGLCIASTLPAADLTQEARDILTKKQNSLISVSALCKMDIKGTGLPIRLGGLGESQESNCNGLVLDASGLTVVCYLSLNPMDRIAGIQIKTSEDGDPVKTKSQLSRIQMRLADGSEVPARLVFKDKELDLAFLVPDPPEGQKAPQFTPVNISSGAKAKEMDEVVVVSRHGKGLGYQPIVETGRISAVITKPRPMYDFSLGGTPRPGSPIFLPDGKLLGMVTTHNVAGGGLLGGGMELLILPAEEITKLAAQARKAAEKKSSEE